MQNLTRWLNRLDRAIAKKEFKFAESFRQILIPGPNQVETEGLLRIEPASHIYIPGSTYQHLHVMGWLDAGGNSFELPDDIGAALTLVTDRRVEVIPAQPLTMEGEPNRKVFLSMSDLPDRRLMGPLDEGFDLDGEFRDLLGGIRSLDDRKSEVINAAMRLHYGACLLFATDLAAAYTLIVAGIETLAGEFHDFSPSWEVWDQARSWEKFIKAQALSDRQAEALRSKLLEKNAHMRLGERFSEYATRGITDAFFEQELSVWVPDIDWARGSVTGGSWHPGPRIGDVNSNVDELKKALKKSYAARSGFVHSGERAVDSINQAVGAYAGYKASAPVPFAILRSLLRHLIFREIDSRCTSRETPPIEDRKAQNVATLLQEAAPFLSNTKKKSR
ncbi:hypothetical protein [Streptomyces sp. NPDC087787]|uniref:hypothetical protein n=1 Tax=Streptomyces sp. NPDC087787 TaxID=3365803 RepID=UPI00381E73D9